MATITDERRPSWCWIDNDVIDTFGPIIGPNAIAVYLVLARHANNETRKAWPSFATIAKMAGISRPTAIKAIGKLVEAGLISAEKRGTGYGDWDSNAYTLLPVKAENSALLGGKGDLPPSKDDQETDGGGKADLPGVVNSVDQGGKGGLLEQDLINKTQYEQEREVREPCYENRSMESSGQEGIAPVVEVIAPQAARPAKTVNKKAGVPKAPPPAEIALVRTITNRYPDKALWEQIISAVSGKSAEDIRACYTAWVARGFNPTNYAWLLEWVPNGIPALPGRNGRNGHAIPSGLPAPEMVWGTVQAEIDRVHYFGTPNLPQPIMAAVEAVGGWYAVSRCDPAGAIPSRLRDAYRSALDAQERHGPYPATSQPGD